MKIVIDTVALRGARKRLGLTQRDLAVIAMLSLPSVTKIERGEHKNVSLGTLAKLATALGLKPGDLLKTTE